MRQMIVMIMLYAPIQKEASHVNANQDTQEMVESVVVSCHV